MKEDEIDTQDSGPGDAGTPVRRVVNLAFGDPVADIFIVIGALLLGLALHFGVNPADGSVVDASVRDTWIPGFLFIGTLPAMAAMFVAPGGVIGITLMFSVQAVAYWALGRAVSWMFSFRS